MAVSGLLTVCFLALSVTVYSVTAGENGLINECVQELGLTQAQLGSVFGAGQDLPDTEISNNLFKCNLQKMKVINTDGSLNHDSNTWVDEAWEADKFIKDCFVKTENQPAEKWGRLIFNCFGKVIIRGPPELFEYAEKQRAKGKGRN